MAKKDKEKKSKLSSILSFIIALVVLEPRLLAVLIPVAIIGGAVYLGIRASKKDSAGPRYTPSSGKTTYLKDCSVPLHRHRDKGAHYVRKGHGQDPWDNCEKEIDPWDRPDIDIRKYQRQK